MKIISPSFRYGEKIPKKYTGEGEDISPALEIDQLPNNTRSLALIMDDPDAPMGTFDHWLAWNLSSSDLHLKEGMHPPKTGLNHFGDQDYRGPLPPKGHGPHRYFFKVYALDSELDLEEGGTKSELLSAMNGHILGYAEYMGTYERQ